MKEDTYVVMKRDGDSYKAGDIALFILSTHKTYNPESKKKESLVYFDKIYNASSPVVINVNSEDFEQVEGLTIDSIIATYLDMNDRGDDKPSLLLSALDSMERRNLLSQYSMLESYRNGAVKYQDLTTLTRE